MFYAYFSRIKIGTANFTINFLRKKTKLNNVGLQRTQCFCGRAGCILHHCLRNLFAYNFTMIRF